MRDVRDRARRAADRRGARSVRSMVEADHRHMGGHRTPSTMCEVSFPFSRSLAQGVPVVGSTQSRAQTKASKRRHQSIDALTAHRSFHTLACPVMTDWSPAHSPINYLILLEMHLICSKPLRRSRLKILLCERIHGVSSGDGHDRTSDACDRAMDRAAWRFARTQGRRRLRKGQPRRHIFGLPMLMLTFGLFAAIAT